MKLQNLTIIENSSKENRNFSKETNTISKDNTKGLEILERQFLKNP